MTFIRIREQFGPDAANAFLNFDGEDADYPITVSDPFSPKQEENLEWYFEEHLRFPFLDNIRAKAAAASITAYGEALFKQVFADPKSHARYTALRGDLPSVRIEIVGSPHFNRYHWEALKDPELSEPLSVLATIIRKNETSRDDITTLNVASTINLLVVTARPGGARDVGYRTISRPLVEGLREAKLPVQVDIARPGTYQALVERLEEVRDRTDTQGYHVVHFDLHGGLLSYTDLQLGMVAKEYTSRPSFGRGAIASYDGHKAFLFFDGLTPGQSDPVEASELAALLAEHQIPIAILNACQSGKQVGASETSLGSHLIATGVRMVLAMGYSVTVSAAELMMHTLYAELFAGKDLSSAIGEARRELHDNKARRAYFNENIDLEDWLLPVVYQNEDVRLAIRDISGVARPEIVEANGRYTAPAPTYGFVGRDVDILEIERRLFLLRNVILVRGMIGVGKTALLEHLAWWWQTTHFVEQVFSFDFRDQVWTLEEILNVIATRLQLPKEQTLLVERLRADRHLVVLDNLESITYGCPANQNTLAQNEQAKLRSFLADLSGGKSVALLGSRGGEEWLAPDTFADNVYDLPGLDPEAASTLAEMILERYEVTKYRQDKDIQKLMKLLDGYPLPLEVVLINLAEQTPAEVLAALEAGDVRLDTGNSQDKTKSILACIDYSYSNFSPEAQELLMCLASFTSVVNTAGLENYSEQLKQQPALAHLPFDGWPAVLQEAANMGLLSEHGEVSGYLCLQPIFPYFLRSRFLLAPHEELKRASETAFRLHYDDFGGAIRHWQNSKEAEEKQYGHVLAYLEYENLVVALKLALDAQASIINMAAVLSAYLDATQDHARRLQLGEMVLAGLDGYPAEILSGAMGDEFAMVVDNIANCQLSLKQYSAAEATYQRALSLLRTNAALSSEESGKYCASVLHQLGRVAEEQMQWSQAEVYYTQALQIRTDFNDRCGQADVYHQLGMVAAEQRQWARAEAYYKQALRIFIDFSDHHKQALTLVNLGMAAEKQQQWANAEQNSKQALQIFIALNDGYSQASTYHQLGGVAREQRQWAQAEAYYKQALRIFIDFNDRYKQASVYQELGLIAQSQRHWAQAEVYYQQALQIYVDFHVRHEEADTYHNLGTVTLEQRQFAQAETYYQQALQIYVDFNDRYHEADTYHNLGAVAEWQGEGAEAAEYYKRALRIFIDFKDRHKQAGTYNQLGSVSQRQRDWTGAEAYYKQALQIYIDLNARYEQASTYSLLGVMAYQQDLWAQARGFLLQGLAIFRQFDDQHRIGVTLSVLALLWRADGDTHLPAAVAKVLGLEVAYAESILRSLSEESQSAPAKRPGKWWHNVFHRREPRRW